MYARACVCVRERQIVRQREGQRQTERARYSSVHVHSLQWWHSVEIDWWNVSFKGEILINLGLLLFCCRSHVHMCMHVWERLLVSVWSSQNTMTTSSSKLIFLVASLMFIFTTILLYQVSFNWIFSHYLHPFQTCVRIQIQAYFRSDMLKYR